MKKILLMMALVLGVSAMAEEATTATKTEDVKTGAMATMKKEAKKVEEKAKEVKEDVKKEAKKAGEKLEEAKDKVEEKMSNTKKDVKADTKKVEEKATDVKTDVKNDAEKVEVKADKVKDNTEVTAVTTKGNSDDSTPAKATAKTPKPEAPIVTAPNTGVVTAKPKDPAKADKITVTYKDEEGSKVTVVGNKGNDGRWTLENNPGVTIDGHTGEITIPADKVKDDTPVTAITKNGNSVDSDPATETARAPKPETPTTEGPTTPEVVTEGSTTSKATLPNTGTAVEMGAWIAGFFALIGGVFVSKRKEINS